MLDYPNNAPGNLSPVETGLKLASTDVAMSKTIKKGGATKGKSACAAWEGGESSNGFGQANSRWFATAAPATNGPAANLSRMML